MLVKLSYLLSTTMFANCSIVVRSSGLVVVVICKQFVGFTIEEVLVLIALFDSELEK